MHLPIGIFSVAISTVALPQLARLATAGETENFRNALSYALRLMLVLTIPAGIGLMVLSAPICRLLYEWGLTLEEDTIGTAGLLFVYAFGLCGFSTLKIVTDGFYAYKDIRAPVIVSICAVALNICLNYLFIYRGFFLDPACCGIFDRLNCDTELWRFTAPTPTQSRRIGVTISRSTDT